MSPSLQCQIKTFLFSDPCLVYLCTSLQNKRHFKPIQIYISTIKRNPALFISSVSYNLNIFSTSCCAYCMAPKRQDVFLVPVYVFSPFLIQPTRTFTPPKKHKLCEDLGHFVHTKQEVRRPDYEAPAHRRTAITHFFLTLRNPYRTKETTQIFLKATVFIRGQFIRKTRTSHNFSNQSTVPPPFSTNPFNSIYKYFYIFSSTENGEQSTQF